MAKVLALRHVPFEDLGLLGPLLAGRGHDIAYLDTPVQDLAGTDPAAADLLVVLGGPIGAYETDTYPFLAAEIAAIERRLKAGRPVLGICLGAQLDGGGARRARRPHGRQGDRLGPAHAHARGQGRAALPSRRHRGAALARRRLRHPGGGDAPRRERALSEPGLRLGRLGAGAPVPCRGFGQGARKLVRRGTPARSPRPPASRSPGCAPRPRAGAQQVTRQGRAFFSNGSTRSACDAGTIPQDARQVHDMHTLIVAVGRWKKGPERALYDAYVRRLRPAPELIEVEEKRTAADTCAHRRRRRAAACQDPCRHLRHRARRPRQGPFQRGFRRPARRAAR